MNPGGGERGLLFSSELTVETDVEGVSEEALTEMRRGRLRAEIDGAEIGGGRRVTTPAIEQSRRQWTRISRGLSILFRFLF